MASILDYLKNLKPLYERREMLTTLSSLRDEHTESLMPVIRDISETFEGHVFKSKLYKDYEQSLRKHINFNQPVIGLILKSIENLQNVFPFLEKEIRESFGPQIATASMTYDSINVLRYMDSVGFYIRYARKFLLKVVADESAVLGGTRPDWVRGELEYLDKNVNNFAGLLVTMLKSDGELRQAFRKVSTATVDSETADLAFRTLGQDKIDPLRIAGFSPQQNVIMSLGKTLVEWNVNRYRAAKEDLVALQMRLQEMRELLSSGKASPVVQNQIKKLEERITKLDTKLAELEDDAREGVAA